MRYEDKTLYLEGALTKNTIAFKLEKLLLTEISEIDLAKISEIDSAGVAFIDELKRKFNAPKIVNISDEIAQNMRIFSPQTLPKTEEKMKENTFIKIGGLVFAQLISVKNAFYLIADIFYWSIFGVFNRKGHRKGSVVQQSILIGMDAVWIVALLSFILGLILALQAAAQLRQFGANIFVADLMALSMVIEMGPFLTAIILAGRSGSAIASEIATMKVTEEVDALKMMAINPIRYIVVPKFHAITICISLLVIISTLVGILGGLVVAVTYLDLSPVAFLTRVFEVVKFRDALIALGKSYFFAWIIVIIGSYYGFSAKGGAEGVGKVTTKAVVASIFWVIIIDAISSLIFYYNVKLI